MTVSICVKNLDEAMIKSKVNIVNKLGLHARAAAKFVATASKYSCEINVQKDARRVNGKSIMGVMMLAASLGSELTLHIDGEDEHDAATALEALVSDKFGEEE